MPQLIFPIFAVFLAVFYNNVPVAEGALDVSHFCTFVLLFIFEDKQMAVFLRDFGSKIMAAEIIAFVLINTTSQCPDLFNFPKSH